MKQMRVTQKWLPVTKVKKHYTTLTQMNRFACRPCSKWINMLGNQILENKVKLHCKILIQMNRTEHMPYWKEP